MCTTERERPSVSSRWGSQIGDDAHLRSAAEQKIRRLNWISCTDWYVKLTWDMKITTVRWTSSMPILGDNWVLLCGGPKPTWKTTDCILSQIVLQRFSSILLTNIGRRQHAPAYQSLGWISQSYFNSPSLKLHGRTQGPLGPLKQAMSYLYSAQMQSCTGTVLLIQAMSRLLPNLTTLTPPPWFWKTW